MTEEVKSGLYRVDSVSTCSTVSTLPRASGKAGAFEREDAESRSLESILSAIYVTASRPTKAEIARGVMLPNLFEDPKRRDHPVYKSLLSQAAELSQIHFHEDAVANVNKKTGYRFLLYCSEDYEDLWGFAVYKLKPTTGTLSVCKLAVPSCYRGLGFGTAMVKELTRLGRANQCESIALSSLPEAIAFYTRIGFKKFDGVVLPTEEGQTYVEGQVFMELRLRKAGKAKGAGSKKKGR
jgi:ribosomal protein S18 acetylase RimI-like enzyme